MINTVAVFVVTGEDSIAITISPFYCCWLSTQSCKHLECIQVFVERRRNCCIISWMVCQYTTCFCGICHTINYLWFDRRLASIVASEYANENGKINAIYKLQNCFLQLFPDQPILLTFVASTIGGSCVALTMQPFDVLATRLYNQRKCNFFPNVIFSQPYYYNKNYVTKHRNGCKREGCIIRRTFGCAYENISDRRTDRFVQRNFSNMDENSAAHCAMFSLL